MLPNGNKYITRWWFKIIRFNFMQSGKLKTVFAAFLITVLTIVSAGSEASVNAGNAAVEIIISNSVFSVDGIPTSLSGYKINGSNYCKIRDVAAIMSGTAGQFSVSYSKEEGTAFWFETPYLGAVGELKKPNVPRYVAPAQSEVNLDGQERVVFSTFIADGEFYYKLKDIADVLGYELVTSDSINVNIKTDKSVSAQVQLPTPEITYDVFSKTNLSAVQFEQMVSGTALEGLGPCFYAMERDKGINGLFALAVACEESGSGTSGLAREDNNFYGLTALGGGWRSFPTRAEGIQYFANYITSSMYMGKTITEIAQIYCPGNEIWPGKIQNIMLRKWALIDPSVLEVDEF